MARKRMEFGDILFKSLCLDTDKKGNQTMNI